MTRVSKKDFRRPLIIEKAARGYTYEEIARDLGVNEKTIRRDREAMGDLPLVEKLIEIQLDEIEEHEDPSVKLKYRGELIKCLRPQRHEARIQTEGRVEIVVVKPE